MGHQSSSKEDADELELQQTTHILQISEEILHLTQDMPDENSSGEPASIGAGHTPASPIKKRSKKYKNRDSKPSKSSRTVSNSRSSVRSIDSLEASTFGSSSTRKSESHRSTMRESTRRVPQSECLDTSALNASELTSCDSSHSDSRQALMSAVHGNIPATGEQKGRNENNDKPDKHPSQNSGHSIERKGAIAPFILTSSSSCRIQPGAAAVGPSGTIDESDSTLDEELAAPAANPASSSSRMLASTERQQQESPVTVTAMAVTRDDWEEEIRDRILREAVVAEVLLTNVSTAPYGASTASIAAASDEFFNSTPLAAPESFLNPTSPTIPAGLVPSSTSQEKPEQAQLHKDKRRRPRSGGCCYEWKWWLLALATLILVMGALGVVFGVLLPSQMQQSPSTSDENDANSNTNLRGPTAIPSTPVPSSRVPDQTLVPTVGFTPPPQFAPTHSPQLAPAPASVPTPVPTLVAPSWTNDKLHTFLRSNTMNGEMGLTEIGYMAFNAITSTGVFHSVPLNGQMLDVFSLLCFYELTNGPVTWLNHQGWGVTPNPCDWYGIGCNNQGRVARLALPNNGIIGGFPKDMETIKNQLAYLDLSGNDLKFDRSNLAGYSSLQHLNLSRVNARGDFEMLLGYQLLFPSLQVVDVSNNTLVGPIPSAFGNLTQLQRMHFHSNELNGTIPTELSHLMNLVSVKLENNGFVGAVPPALCQPKSSGSSPLVSVDCAEVSCTCCQCF